MASASRDGDVQSRLQALELENSKLKDENRILQEQKRDAGVLLAEVVARRDELDTRVLRTLEPAYCAPMSLSELRESLRRLFSLADEGVEEACKEISLADALQHIGMCSDKSFVSIETFRDSLAKSTVMQRPGIAATFILSAVVHTTMCAMLRDPFFAFTGRPSDPIFRERTKESLQHILGLIRTYDLEGAEGLRWRLLRLLDPKDYRPDKARAGVQNIAKASRAHAADSAAKEVVDRASSLISADRRGQLLKSLRSVFGELADLTWELWTRKAHIQLVHWADILEQEGTESLESVLGSSQDMEPHQLQHAQMLRELPVSFRKEVVFMHCCAIEICGSQQDGDSYDDLIVNLRPAVVWLG